MPFPAHSRSAPVPAHLQLQHDSLYLEASLSTEDGFISLQPGKPRGNLRALFHPGKSLWGCAVIDSAPAALTGWVHHGAEASHPGAVWDRGLWLTSSHIPRFRIPKHSPTSRSPGLGALACSSSQCPGSHLAAQGGPTCTTPSPWNTTPGEGKGTCQGSRG